MGLLPLVMHVCGCTLHQLVDAPSSDAAAVSCSKHDSQSNNSLSRTAKESRWKTFVLVCLISLNLPIALYTCLIHQRGTIDVMTFLYAEAQKPVAKDLMSVLFLMPCHSTPFYRCVSLVFETPRVGFGAHVCYHCRISPPRFLAERRLNQGSFVLLFLGCLLCLICI